MIKQQSPRKPKRARRGHKKQTNQQGRERKGMENRLRKKWGLEKGDPLPTSTGRVSPWLGMRDHAPEENGPVRVRKIEDK